MNDQNFEKLSMLKEERLSKEERVLLRDRVTTFMSLNPIPQTSSPYISSFRKMGKPIAVSSVLAIFALSAGVSYASEAALPGDLLYPVKVRVNEVVRATVARTPTAKAELAQKQIERRVEETEALVKRDKVDDETKETLRKEATRAMDTFADAQKALIKEGKKKEAEQRTEEVDQTFKEHREALSKLEVKVFRSIDKEDRRGKPFEKEEIRGQVNSTSPDSSKDRTVRRRSEASSQVLPSGTSTQVDTVRTRGDSGFSGEKEDDSRRDRWERMENEDDHEEETED